jgi:HAE1 family hydrophobic/amphiphilic exporter-1
MFLSKLSIKRPVLTTVIIITLLVFGLMAYLGISIDLMPNVKIPVVTVQTIYPGASSSDIETQVSKKVEDAISTISKIDYIQSYSMENASFVVIRFKIGKDVDIANQEVKDKVDTIINEFPTDVKKPIVMKFDIGLKPIMDLVLTGTATSKDLYDFADKNLKDAFSQMDGVAQVNLIGGEKREIQVQTSNKTVYTNNLSIPQLSQILAANNLNLPAGDFVQKDYKENVRTDGEFSSINQLQNLTIPTSKGLKNLSQISTIKDTVAKVTERSIYFNRVENKKRDNVVRLSIVKSSEGNAVKVAEELKKSLPAIKKSLPNSMKLSIVNDSSIFINSSVSDTLSNILLGILLTGMVLLFFLHDLRSTIIVAVAMPISMIATFILIKSAGYTINIMSLMGLSTSVGVLVSNSVVVLENIFRHKNKGNERKTAADVGTAEVALAVIASTLTNIIVFLPLGSMQSIVGQFFKQFAMTVVFATIFSLYLSFTLTPMMASLMLPEKNKKGKLGQILENIFVGWEKIYENILRHILHNKIRLVGVLVLIVILFVGSLQLAKTIGFEFIPMLDEGNIQVQVELPQGTNLDETEKVMNQILDLIKRHKEVKHVLINLGKIDDFNKGSNVAIASIKLVDAKERNVTTNQINNTLIEEFANIPNVAIKSTAISSGGGSGDAPIDFFLIGPDLSKLENYENEIGNNLRNNVKDLINFDSSSRTGKPEISLIPKRDKLAEAGLTVMDVAFAVRTSIEGIVSTKYRENGNEYDIRVKLDPASYDSEENIGNLTIVTQHGKYRLAQLADVKMKSSQTTIRHRDKLKAIEFTGSPAIGVPLGDVMKEINVELKKTNLDYGYKIQWAGDSQMMTDTVKDMAKAFILAILLTYLLLSAILESFIQPLLILITIPLALIGVFLALYFTGLTMNIFSMMAIIMLVGIVVNNAILLLDYTKQQISAGKSVHDALIIACPTKLKPILMSSLAVMLGMLPMALGIGSAGKEFRQAMGVVSIGGLVVSTFLTLLVIPILFYLTTKSKKQ